jgi:hypothetical protein
VILTTDKEREMTHPQAARPCAADVMLARCMSGIPLVAAVAKTSQIASFVPEHKVAALQPAARGQEPRDRKPAERKALAGLRAPS